MTCDEIQVWYEDPIARTGKTGTGDTICECGGSLAAAAAAAAAAEQVAAPTAQVAAAAAAVALARTAEQQAVSPSRRSVAAEAGSRRPRGISTGMAAAAQLTRLPTAQARKQAAPTSRRNEAAAMGSCVSQRAPLLALDRSGYLHAARVRGSSQAQRRCLPARLRRPGYQCRTRHRRQPPARRARPKTTP